MPGTAFRRTTRASMGPRSVERGKVASRQATTDVGHASMGPRSVERGKSEHGIDNFVILAASMGPRSVERGKRANRCGSQGTGRLQWGRVLLNAESAHG